MTKKPNMKTRLIVNDSAIYQTKNGAITLKQDVSSDMLWASQAHIADIFEIERSVVTKHIRNILKDKELDEDSVRAKLAHTAEDGKSYQVQFYSLDVILASDTVKYQASFYDYLKIYGKTTLLHEVARSGDLATIAALLPVIELRLLYSLVLSVLVNYSGKLVNFK